MTSEIEEAVARVEKRINLLERPVNYAAFFGDSEGADAAEVAAYHNKREAALLRTILSALAASQAEVERLTRERDEARRRRDDAIASLSRMCGDA